jgi:hypothetical protein
MRRSDARGGFYRGEPQNSFKTKVHHVRPSVLGLEEGRGTPHPPMAEDRIPRTFVGPFLGSTDALPSQDRHEAAEQTGPIRIGVRLGRVEFYGPAQVP